MKKILNFMPLLLLCGCLTTSPTTEEPPDVSPAEPELAIEKDVATPEIKEVKDNVSVVEGTEIIDLKPKEVKVAVKPVVIMKTSMGDVKIELDPEKAPITVKNFLNYVDSKYYNGTIFHRVISGFMIQGGGLTPNMHQRRTSKPIKNEAYNGLSNERGTVAMARTNIVDSATSQFFINVKDNNFLDHKDKSARNFGYCVFGKVIDGMDVVDKIQNVKTGKSGYTRDVPLQPVIIKEIAREVK